MNMQQKLYAYLEASQGFANKYIEQAFREIDRADFVLSEYREMAYQDTALPIGHGATISQPTTVLFMLNQLQPSRSEKILDVGSGSGWTTALLAKIVGDSGEVIGTEIVPELVKFGNKNLKKYNFKNAKIILAGKRLGLSRQAPFDRILVSAAAAKLPDELPKQLTVGGRIIIPVQGSIWKIDRISKNKFDEQEFPGFLFVPLKS